MQKKQDMRDNVEEGAGEGKDVVGGFDREMGNRRISSW